LVVSQRLRRAAAATVQRAARRSASGKRAWQRFPHFALLLIGVVGSGIAAQRLSPSDTGLALLENAVATGAALVAIILALGSVSGAQLNPIVSTADAFFGGLRPRELTAYVLAQLAGAAVGAIFANLMFSLPALTVSTQVRSSPGLWLGEVLATFGLLLVIFGVVRSGRNSRRSVCGRRVHHRCVLLYLVHQLRQSRGDSGPHTV